MINIQKVKAGVLIYIHFSQLYLYINIYLLPTLILHIYHAKLVQLVQKQNHAKNNGKQNLKKNKKLTNTV